VATVAVLVPVLAGCEAGNNAPTLAFHYPTDAAGTAVGALSIRNVFVLGAPLGQDLAMGQSASLFLSLINGDPRTPDRLISISAPGTATTVTLPAGGIPVVTNRPIYYSGPMPQVVLRDLTRAVRSGSTVTLVLSFQRAGPIRLQVPVMPRASQFATFAPPSISPSPGSGQPSAHGAATPTPTASVTPSPSAS
jgi:hypothetical protein